uniref:Peptidase S8/S53 domain-containing protein n=1 Tax=Timema bartmani TaxID=61472 RepID=A0A7R9EZJ2_9NEOP|nr:unnamed protein product [Timema bartmani]
MQLEVMNQLGNLPTYVGRAGESSNIDVIIYNRELNQLGNLPTYVGRDGESSNIDVIIYNREAAVNIRNWKVLDKMTISDHNLITLEIETREAVQVEARKSLRYNISKAGWDNLSWEAVQEELRNNGWGIPFKIATEKIRPPSMISTLRKPGGDMTLCWEESAKLLLDTLLPDDDADPDNDDEDQMTSDGRKKVVERYDCSGAGDVDTSIVVQANNDGNIVGVSGRLLKIPSEWTNPSGQFHIGIVNCYDLYPAKLRERIEKYRKEKLWDPGFKKVFADTMRKLQDFEKETPQLTTLKDKFTKEDLEIRMELLSSLEKKYCDPGPAFDCVVFHDGICWRLVNAIFNNKTNLRMYHSIACLDTSECGDMTSCKLLGEYSVTHEYAAISTVDQFNYSINVHNDGNTLEVVGMCSSHGTHVASIAAAYFEDSPEKNGIAPGAQIVSFTIGWYVLFKGDNRLNSMETGTSLVRAMIQVMQRQNDPETRIHIINMSYGEHTHFSSSGRIGELMAEVIDKHGLIWVASAGNNGPALCTIGTPPDICTNNVIETHRNLLCEVGKTGCCEGETGQSVRGMATCRHGWEDVLNLILESNRQRDQTLFEMMRSQQHQIPELTYNIMPDLVKTIPHFDGESLGMNASEWLQIINTMAELHKWQNPFKLESARTHLIGAAQQ